ncbi:glycosyltransferase family 2 protein [Leifsonia sp. L25]|uniref:glycosyltransferase family 2 protein n=1 Tax=Actinomycetes TaxID=1760 RepID=UPI003D698EF5
MSDTPALDPLPSATVILSLRDVGEGAESLAGRIRRLARVEGVDVLVVDDGSTDGSAERLEQSLRTANGVAYVRHTDNAGVAARRNEALARASGEYVWFVDHDDDWSESGLAALRAHAAGVDVVVGRADFRWGPDALDRRRIDGAEVAAPREVDARAAATLLLDGTIHGFLWSKLFRRASLGVDPFPRIVSQSDIVGVAGAIARAQRARLIPETVYTYIRQPGSITRRRRPDLGALERAHDDVLALLADALTPALRDLFTARFLCLAAVKTAVRWNADRAAVDEALLLARRRARGLSIQSIARRSPGLAGSVLLLRTVPALLPLALRSALAVLDLGRRVRRPQRREEHDV